jgi:hypothetical protein
MIPPRTKTVRLVFKRDELLYDCQNIAYIEGDVMKTDDAHDRHQLQDIVEEGNVDRVTRVLDLAIAECVEACYPYSKIPVGQTTDMDDTLTETQNYIVKLWVPDDFSHTTVVLLERMIHELLVCRVLADWFSITYPDKAAAWGAKADAAKEEIHSNLNARIGRVRKTQTPF